MVSFQSDASRLHRFAILTSAVLLQFSLLDGQSVQAGDWPQFRGPDGQGHGESTELPLRWSERRNVAWKVRIPGDGWSSPVIRGSQIWMTTATQSGRSLRAVCVDRDSGRLLHNVEVIRVAQPGRIHAKNSRATPTPVLDGDRMYVHFGSHGTACLTDKGEVVWTTRLKYYHHHGPAGSPVIVGDLLIVNCDGFIRPFYDKRVIDGIDEFQFVAALDKKTGKLRWKAGRKGQHSYSTPLLIDVDGRQQLISCGGDRVTAYDPDDGSEIWSCRYKGYSVVPRPVFGHGLVYICTGYDVAQLYAIRPTGKGDVTETHVAWKQRQSIPLNPSPLLVNDELYLISDTGVASCLDAKTGSIHWKKRFRGPFSASPVYAAGRIYFLNETGQTTVIVPGRTFQAAAVNVLQGRGFASPAISETAIFLRTDRNLYRLQEAAASR